jgi:hypothetical protein
MLTVLAAVGPASGSAQVKADVHMRLGGVVEVLTW